MNRKIVLIAPEPPPYGGMANQSRLLGGCLAKENVLVYSVPTNRAPVIFFKKMWEIAGFRTVGKFFKYIFGIIGTIKQCSVIHILACSHVYFFLNVIPAVIIGKVFKKKVIINYRGGEAATFFSGFAGNFLWVFRLADTVIVPSGFLQSVFQNLGVSTEIIPNISEVGRFHFSLPDYSDHIKFICTRNFEPYYDILTLVKSFELVKKILPKASLTLIGEGTLKKDILNYVMHAGLTDSVSFPGRIDPQDMPGYLLKHDIYVNSSVVDNYPISLLEAFSSGLPVVSTAAGGIPYMVEHCETGLLVQPENPQALAGEMIRLANDVALGERLAVHAKRLADKHSWEKIWPKLKAAYNWAG